MARKGTHSRDLALKERDRTVAREEYRVKNVLIYFRVR